MNSEYAIREEEGLFALYLVRESRDLWIDNFPSREAAEEYQMKHQKEGERFDGIASDFWKWAYQWVAQKAEETGFEESYIRQAIGGLGGGPASKSCSYPPSY